MNKIIQGRPADATKILTKRLDAVNQDYDALVKAFAQAGPALTTTKMSAHALEALTAVVNAPAVTPKDYSAALGAVRNLRAQVEAFRTEVGATAHDQILEKKFAHQYSDSSPGNGWYDMASDYLSLMKDQEANWNRDGQLAAAKKGMDVVREKHPEMGEVLNALDRLTKTLDHAGLAVQDDNRRIENILIGVLGSGAFAMAATIMTYAMTHG